MSNINNELKVLEREIDGAIRTTKQRNVKSAVLCVLSAGLIAGWLYHAHTRFAAVDPGFAADYAQAQLTSYMPQAGTDLEGSLKAYAPQFVGDLSKRLEQVPDQFADELDSRMKAELNAAGPQIEGELYKSLKTALADQKGIKGGDDVARFKSMLGALAETYEKESIQWSDQLHSEYTKNGSDLLAYVQTLAENKNLNRHQQLQREMLQSFLVAAKQTDEASAR
ncbi:MAG TPA: hypothetical protein VFE58_03985 [Tepidisphaeraceae bacterium]|nr:hypothetical protein [Tepidisphaeraceae bacterium]